MQPIRTLLHTLLAPIHPRSRRSSGFAEASLVLEDPEPELLTLIEDLMQPVGGKGQPG